MRYKLQMYGSISILQWGYDVDFSSDEFAVKWAESAIAHCNAAKQAAQIALFNLDKDETVAVWTFSEPKPVRSVINQY